MVICSGTHVDIDTRQRENCIVAFKLFGAATVPPMVSGCSCWA